MNIIKLFIFMGVSGSGKSSIQHSLPINFLTNCTTRKLRKGEVNGYDINEVSFEEFEQLKNQRYFIETSSYAGNNYGTPRHLIDNIYDGIPYHCTKDINGALKLKEFLGDRAVIIYIKPPSVDEVIKRMKIRGDTEDQIHKRIDYIEKVNEWDSAKHADYIIVNKDLKDSQLEAHTIVIEELLFSMANKDVSHYINKLYNK